MSTAASTSDQWSKHSWSWAAPEQRDWLKEVEPHYAQAILGKVEGMFFKALRTQWFLRWPAIPELISDGRLPPEASNNGFEASDEQWQMLKDYREQRFEQVKNTLTWLRRVRWQQERGMCLVDGPHPPFDSHVSRGAGGVDGTGIVED